MMFVPLHWPLEIAELIFCPTITMGKQVFARLSIILDAKAMKIVSKLKNNANVNVDATEVLVSRFVIFFLFKQFFQL